MRYRFLLPRVLPLALLLAIATGVAPVRTQQGDRAQALYAQIDRIFK